MKGITALTIVKAHSARVPRKNFRSLGGRPLFAHILSSLAEVEAIGRTVIDTDAADELRSAGLTESETLVLRERPAGLRGDDVTANTLLAAMLSDLPGEVFLMTHVTNPFLSARTIARAIERFAQALASGEADSLVGVNVHRARFFDAGGRAIEHDPVLYEEGSTLYLFTRASFTETGSRIGRRPLWFEVPKRESLDIDDEEDWLAAEILAQGGSRGLL